MISFALLHNIANKLEAFRADGRSNVIFDRRDKGNYAGYHWEETVALLTKSDPTGFSLALLINEMIEATIDGSQVKLSRILREPGFTQQLHDILLFKDELMSVLESPMLTFHQRIESLINEVSPAFGTPNTREVALAMRDAIYCIDSGMSVRWVACDKGAGNPSIGLQKDIVIVPSLADFVQKLRQSLPCGVHLARIGHDSTAIGFKKPGRIAYMSSMKVDAKTGGMTEERHNGAHLSETLDIDGFAHRYPRWINIKYSGSQSTHTDAGITSVEQIPRDSMIWLAMMIELANQDMGRVDPDTIRLSESGRLAISHGPSKSNLPVPYQASWVLSPPSLDDMLASLELGEWELSFLRDGLDGVNPLDFIPVGETGVGMHLTKKTLVPREKNGNRLSIFEQDKGSLSVPFTSISEGIAGTQEEIQKVVRSIFRTNLANYLLSYGNRKFIALWKADQPWFLEKLTANALPAMDAACSKVQLTDFERWGAPNVFKQNPKNKGFKAMCFVKGKGDCDVKTHVYPQNDEQLVEVLGLSSIDELPPYLHGWSRNQGWTTDDNNSQQNPGETTLRWFFTCDKDGICDDPESAYEGFIYFNSANHPRGATKPNW
jgi:hypothetical protein